MSERQKCLRGLHDRVIFSHDWRYATGFPDMQFISKKAKKHNTPLK
jgi:hypothetical protein